MTFHTEYGCDDSCFPMIETVGEKRQEASFPIVRERLNKYVHDPIAAEVKLPDDVIIRHRIIGDHPGFVPLKHPPGLVEYVALKAATAY
jgi:hypothetical protein